MCWCVGQQGWRARGLLGIPVLCFTRHRDGPFQRQGCNGTACGILDTQGKLVHNECAPCRVFSYSPVHLTVAHGTVGVSRQLRLGTTGIGTAHGHGVTREFPLPRTASAVSRCCTRLGPRNFSHMCDGCRPQLQPPSETPHAKEYIQGYCTACTPSIGSGLVPASNPISAWAVCNKWQCPHCTADTRSTPALWPRQHRYAPPQCKVSHMTRVLTAYTFPFHHCSLLYLVHGQPQHRRHAITPTALDQRGHPSACMSCTAFGAGGRHACNSPDGLANITPQQ